MANKINVVISGKYENSKLINDLKIKCVKLFDVSDGCSLIDAFKDSNKVHFFIKEEINDINIIDKSTKISLSKSVVGAATLGIGGILLGIKDNELLIEVVWRDNEKSLIKVDKKMCEQIYASFYSDYSRNYLIQKIKDNMEETKNNENDFLGIIMLIIIVIICIWSFANA